MTAAALDIGGTHVSAAGVDLQTAAVRPSVRIDHVPHASRDELLQSILRAADSVAATMITSVGVAVPGPFDYDRGICTIRGVGKLEALYGVDLRRELAGAFDLRGEAVVFLNDAEAFLLGESAHGAARGHARAIGITLGTGLGSAFLVDGLIVRKGCGIPPDGSLHLARFRGAPVEDRLSARGLLARVPGDQLDVREVAERARSGDSDARRVFAAFGDELAEFLQPWVRGFLPSCVVVGGSISRSWDLLGVGLQAALPIVTPAARLDDAALLGAAQHAAGGSA
jgi:glucokinase